MKALRFRLYPNQEQEERLLEMLEAARQLWNDALGHRKWRWERFRQSTSYNHQQWVLTSERHRDARLGRVYSQVAQDVLRRLDGAFRAFFEHRARLPKFKRFKESGSLTYPQAYNGSAKPDVRGKRLFLSKVGNVKAVFHRPPPRDARLKTCTVGHEPNGEWYASLVYEEVVPLRGIDIQINSASKTVVSPIGVDLGLKSLITTSDGIGTPHPKFLRNAEMKLKRIQKWYSRKRRSSRNQEKARLLLAVQHAKVARRRKDFNHKPSTELVRGHDLIAFEDLRVGNLVKNHALAKSIHDAGWGQLVSFAEYKANEKGKLFITVEAAYSTQECFYCECLYHISLGIREFACEGCGRKLNRDVNAARNVLKRALAKVGQDMPERTPVETGPLPAQQTGRASLIVEAGTDASQNEAGRMSR